MHRYLLYRYTGLFLNTLFNARCIGSPEKSRLLIFGFFSLYRLCACEESKTNPILGH